MNDSEIPVPVDVDALLEQSSWVRALAGRLVADPHHADDVAQDAMVRALRRRPDRRGSLRAWLATVTRSAARQERRAARRRTRRESIASVDEAVPSAGKLAEEAEVQQALLASVLDLEEPYRSAVMLRYFRDMSSADIAAQLGVPASTIRNRLKRALDELRHNLDGRFGQRTTWTAMLAPWLVPMSAAGTASAASGPAAAAGKGPTPGCGGGAMGPGGGTIAASAVGEVVAMFSAGAKIGIGVLLVVAVGAGLFLARERLMPPAEERLHAGSSIEDDDASPDGLARRSAAVDGVLPAESGSPAAVAAAASGRRIVVRGSVVDAAGGPVADATIGAWLEEWHPDGSIAPPWETVTDRTGAFAFDVAVHDDVAADVGVDVGVGVGASGRVFLRAEADGFFPEMRVPVDHGDDESRIVLARAAQLVGRVVDSVDQSPVPSALVMLSEANGEVDFECTADDSGQYRFELLPEGIHVNIDAHAKGYPKQDSQSFRLEAGLNRHDVSMDPGLAFRVEVTDLISRKGVEGAAVYDAGRGHLLGTTDELGTLAIRTAPEHYAGAFVDLVAIAPGYCGLRRVVRKPEELEDGRTIRLALPMSASVEGVVSDDAGKPVSGARVSVRQGEFLARELLELDPGLEEVVRGDDRLTEYRRHTTVITDDDGKYRIGDVLVGSEPPSLQAVHRDHVTARARLAHRLAPADAVRLDFVMHRSGSIEGVVRLNGERVETTLRAISDSGVRHARSFDGTFRISGLGAGTVRVEVSDPADPASRRPPRQIREVTVIPGEVSRCEIDLAIELQAISGRVLSSAGEPCPGASVTVTSSEHLLHSTTSDSEGRYRVEVDAGAGSLYTVAAGPVSIAGVAAGSSNVDLRLPPMASLRLRARDTSDGSLVLSYEVRARNAEGRTFRFRVGSSILPSAAGIVAIELPVGTYDLFANHDDHSYRAETLTGVMVGPESADVVELPFDPGTRFRIQWEGDLTSLPPAYRALMLLEESDHARMRVDLPDKAATRPAWNNSISMSLEGDSEGFDYSKHMLAIDDSGTWDLVGLRPGAYRIRCWPDELEFEPETIIVPESETASVTVRWRLKD